MSIWFPEDDDHKIESLKKEHLKNFECEVPELNYYFQNNALDNENELISKNYVFIRKNDNFPCALFTISNAEIKSSIETDMVMSENCKYKSYPAVRIGRLAVHKEVSRQGIGSKLLLFIKIWFSLSNKTGCRYILVDSRKEAVVFYKKNGFEEYLGNETASKYPVLIFDLMPFRYKIESFTK